MEKIWFRKTMNGLFWKPISWQGWATTIMWAFANVWYFRRVDAASHSGSDTLMQWGVFFIITTIIFLFVVKHRSEREWI